MRPVYNSDTRRSYWKECLWGGGLHSCTANFVRGWVLGFGFTAVEPVSDSFNRMSDTFARTGFCASCVSFRSLLFSVFLREKKLAWVAFYFLKERRPQHQQEDRQGGDVRLGEQNQLCGFSQSPRWTSQPLYCWCGRRT